MQSLIAIARSRALKRQRCVQNMPRAKEGHNIVGTIVSTPDYGTSEPIETFPTGLITSDNYFDEKKMIKYFAMIIA